MRIANNTMIRNYTRTLNSGKVRMGSYSEKITTQRRFNSMNEDTSAGIRALQLRRTLDSAQSHMDTAKTVSSQFKAAESQMMKIVDLGKDIAVRYTNALNGTNGPDERKAIAGEIEKLRDQMLACANGQFADRYMFGGSNTDKAPFTLDDGGNLLYNGISVADMADANGNMKPEYQYLLDDKTFVDLGLGLKNGENGALLETTAFQSSLNGLDFLGIGDNNIYQVCNQILDKLKEGDYKSFSNNEETAALLDKITNCYKNVTLQVTELGASYQYLDFTVDRLTDDRINLIERQDEIEFNDPAEAIMQFKMQEYAYNASLQMGQRLLQPTIFSFIN